MQRNGIWGHAVEALRKKFLVFVIELMVEHLAPVEAFTRLGYPFLEERQRIRWRGRNRKVLPSYKHNWFLFADGVEKKFCCKSLHVLRVPFDELVVWHSALPPSVGY